MNNEQKHSGFSLTEVLIAVGILAVGMTFIAGVFPAGIYLTTIATERTIAAVAADEAFAKIKIYARGDLGDLTDDVNLVNLTQMMDFNDAVFPATAGIDPNEFEYPSTDTNEPNQYCWSALCRRVGLGPNRLVQVTVFISRKVSPILVYPDPNGGGTVNRPMPVRVNVSGIAGNNELTITGDKTFINDGYTIVDDATGRIYRVLERYKAPDDNTILLDRDWQGGSSGSVWVVPPPVIWNPPNPPVIHGRYPCITVYQKVIRF
jgi:prepilin-type N-terminal cleavage/methylation domain-containing protein